MNVGEAVRDRLRKSTTKVKRKKKVMLKVRFTLATISAF